MSQPSMNPAQVLMQRIAPQRGCWDDTEDMYQRAIAAIGSATYVSEYLTYIRINGNPDQTIRSQSLGRAIMSDLQSSMDTLNRLHNAHAGKSGNPLSGDDLVLSISICESYNNWFASWSNTTLPLVNSLTQLFEEVRNGKQLS